MKEREVILTTKNLTKSFNGITAVNKVDLNITRGEIVALIGPNGSGKTTLFDLITGIYPPTYGSIFFGDSNINLLKLTSDEIVAKGISRTFQNSRIFLQLTVLENVMVGMDRSLKTGFFGSIFRLRHTKLEEKKAEERAFELLSIFGERLLAMANEPAMVLSYANRRRLEIARALASDPVLLLLDEPSAGMNPVETFEIMEDIQKIHERNITIFFIEHKMEMVEDIAQRIIALNQGFKIAEGRFDEVKESNEVIEAYLGKRMKKDA